MSSSGSSGMSARGKLSFSSSSGTESEVRATEASAKAHQSMTDDTRALNAEEWCKQDAHQLRLKELRSSLLKHIQDTDWMYSPAEKFVGKQ